MKSYSLGEGATLQEGAIAGHIYKENFIPTTIGSHSVIRTGTIIYTDVATGEHFQTGHNVLVRGETTIGDHVGLGTNTIIDGHVNIGSFVKIESSCYIPTHVTIGNRVFLGPGVTITNDRFPLKMRDAYKIEGPEKTIIEDLVTIGGAVTLCPGVRIGRGSFIAAGAVVTKDVPEMSLVVGVPGKVSALPEYLREPNMALSWGKFVADYPAIFAK